MSSQLHALRVALVGLVLALFYCGPASASFSAPVKIEYSANYNGNLYTAPTPEEACTKAAAANGDVSLGGGGGLCRYQVVGGGTVSGGAIPYCPTNADLGGNQCTCKAGFPESIDASGVGSCGKPPNLSCIEGAVAVNNFTIAWSRTSNQGADAVDGIIGKVSMPGINYKTACIADCQYSMDSNAVTRGYVSQTPSAEGLYRISADATTVNTGSQCNSQTASDVGDLAAKPDPAPLKCPGFVGQVNGQTTCVGTASAPLPSPSGDTNALASNFATKGDKGNPAAGPVPATGDGSGTGGTGRTPSVGVGSASGGPASASNGGTGSGSNAGSGNGTVNKPGEGKEQQNCGAPGQPKCVLDETGTPAPYDKDKYSSELDSAKSEAETARNTISGTSDKGFLEGFRSSLVSAPPVVGCIALELPKDMGAINPCPVVDGVRAVMAYLWAAAALFLCFRMIKQVI